jgi:Glycosyltransferase family 87
MISSRLLPAIETVMTRALQLRRFDDRVFRISIVLVTMASFALSIARILQSHHLQNLQRDLKVYYNSPLLLAEGQDPYGDGGFVFPPIYLQIFRFFSSPFTYDQFYWVFLVAKILTFAILLAIWKKCFLKETQLHIFAIFVWLGFYSTVLIDFQAGNVTVFETMILFLAFLCYLKNYLYLFVFLIILGASIKITPIFFLILLLLTPNRYSLRYFTLGCVGFLAYAMLNLILFPDLTKQFISQAMTRITDETDTGFVNPSSLAFINDTLTSSLDHFSLIPSPMLVDVVYLAVCIWILWTSWTAWGLVKITDQRNNYNLSFLVLFSILVYALIMPRMKNYAYMIAIPSVLFAIEHFEILVPRWIVFLPLVLISPIYPRPPLFRVFPDYYPLFVASFFWYLYLRELKKKLACDRPASPSARAAASGPDSPLDRHPRRLLKLLHKPQNPE